ncbi:MAG: stage II sporulation protein M [Lentisphaeraceae bacterium]|nr:stage II sporulation protein M [Lentisphaeraceae bacterium]
MKQHYFEEKNKDRWSQIETVLSAKKKEFNKDFPALYRQACRDLAIARERHYSAYLIQNLEDLVEKGHQHLYGRKGRGNFGIINYFSREFPALIRQEWRLVLFSHMLFYLPFFLMLVMIQFYPHISYMVIPEDSILQMEEIYDPASGHFEEQRSAADDIQMLGFYIFNNVGIDFKCFAGGILGGIGSVFFIFYNGLMIGAVAGHITALGFTDTFWPFVAGHSALELTAAVFAGACGMKMGFALIRPGNLTRLAALKKASLTGVKMLYGTAFMTFSAAFIEAFWSSNVSISDNTKYIFGATFWLLVILYFTFAGRGYEPEQN